MWLNVFSYFCMLKEKRKTLSNVINSIAWHLIRLFWTHSAHSLFLFLSYLFLFIIADGITYTFGIMYVEFLNEFNEGKGYTYWILSLMSGMTLCSGNDQSWFIIMMNIYVNQNFGLTNIFLLLLWRSNFILLC